MSRNGSGVYSLPAGNPVVTGTTISSSWANTTLSDIATALTGSVAADGQTAMTGNLQMGNNKITGLAVATASGDALSYGQAATISALTVSGAFSANGGATLGDASGDALTINSSAVSIPNGLNFDSNTFVIDAANNNVGIGTASPITKLDVVGSAGVTSFTGTTRLGVTVRGSTSTNDYSGIDFTSATVNSPTARIAALTGSSGSSLQFGTSNLYASGITNTAMTIDSTGNVGIGTSSPATIVHAQKASGNTYYRAQNNLANVDFGVDGAGAGILWNNSNYPLAFGTNNTERMRIDSNGNVGIGTSSPANFGSAFKMLAVQGSDYGVIQAISNSGSTTLEMMGASGIGYVGTRTNHPLAFRTNDTERMRLDSSGNLLVARTSTFSTPGGDTPKIYSAGALGVISGSTVSAYSSDRINFNASTYYVLGSSTGGGVKLDNGTTAWAAQSDETTKDIIEPISNGIAKVNNIRAVIGKYKEDVEGTRRSFLIAQDVQAVLPEAVSTSSDGLLSLRYTEVIPLLVAAIKEQQAIITDLKARIEAIESK